MRWGSGYEPGGLRFQNLVPADDLGSVGSAGWGVRRGRVALRIGRSLALALELLQLLQGFEITVRQTGFVAGELGEGLAPAARAVSSGSRVAWRGWGFGVYGWKRALESVGWDF
jgi:hypothetical protein